MDKSSFSGEYKVFLDLLKELRVKAGVTQTNLADALCENQSFVSKCERGERRLDIIELRRFCSAIGISLTEFSEQLEEHLSNAEDSYE